MTMMMTTMAMNIMMMPARTIFHFDYLLKMFLTKANIRYDHTSAGGGEADC